MKEPNTPKIDQLSEEAYVDPIGKTLTTSLGVPVADNQNSLKINEKGPTLLEDFLLRDKLIHFDRERIPERVVHARGSVLMVTFKLIPVMKNGLKLSS
jgi:catalase